MSTDAGNGPFANDPSGPMWETFLAAHPEVTLVLLPSELPPGDDAREALAADSPSSEGAGHHVPLGDALEAMATLTRKLRLVAEMMQVPEDVAISTGWKLRQTSQVQPQLQLRSETTEDILDDGEMIALRLERLGWNAKHLAVENPVLVDATSAGLLLSVTVTDDWLSLRLVGLEFAVDPNDVESLRGTDND